ncbi:hypothetical protein HMPREF0083_03660 [Aneurinibacillus aneurinilyticus ATCC 12856]|uniref:Uncharacterized protein n=1 Tax=Aneurinibacillus aneurinilyticus ATCC 12856 TaxID=649747 RepID=U1X1I5_ANEAE|nr:hypothetical protein HMPREF0083_03660 [Aneurinibacillus aneurinilyticus ATCC 12856]
MGHPSSRKKEENRSFDIMKSPQQTKYQKGTIFLCTLIIPLASSIDFH